MVEAARENNLLTVSVTDRREREITSKQTESVRRTPGTERTVRTVQTEQRKHRGGEQLPGELQEE